jgi:hypothetical protein
MKTTLNLEDDLSDKLASATQKTGLPLEQVVQQALKLDLEKMVQTIPIKARPFQQRTYDLGVRPGVNLDKALALASEIEDEEASAKRPPNE